MFKLLKDRWTACTPPFFRFFVEKGCILGGFGLAYIPFVGSLPAKLQAIPGYFIAIGASAAGVAKLAKQDPDAVADADKFLNQSK